LPSVLLRNISAIRSPATAIANVLCNKTDCKSKHHGLGGKHGVDLVGGCVLLIGNV